MVARGPEPLKVLCLAITEPSPGAWGFGWDRASLEDEAERMRRRLARIAEELRAEGYSLRLEFETISSEEDAIDKYEIIEKADVLLIMAASGGTSTLRALLSYGKPTVMFVKMHDDRFYLYAEIINPRILRGERDHIVIPYSNDVFVVFDRDEDLKAVLRALHGVYQARRTRLVFIGLPRGWQGYYGEMRALRKVLGLSVIYLTFDKFYNFMEEILKERETAEEIERKARELKKLAERVEVDDKALEAGLKIYAALKRLLERYNANAITITVAQEPGCMGMGLSRFGATPCLAFALLNDEGYVAVCEGDSAVIAAALLLRYISSRPVMIMDPAVPTYGNRILLAHCTSPTKLRGFSKPREKFIVTTHFESGAPVAPKVLYSEGEITMADPSFDLSRFVIGKGRVVRWADYPACRCQMEVEVTDAKRWFESWVGFHWAAVYGDYVRELEIALRALGINYTIV